MNEIEKMYDNCNLLKPHGWSCKLDRIGDGEICELKKEVLHCKNCKYSKQEYYHKTFTAEKQLELIKWIAHHDGCFKVYLNSIEFGDSGFGSCSTFEESLAKAVSNFLRSATDKEKQQIKEILE